MTVYLLWHIGHQNEAGDGGATLHLDGETVRIDEQDGDDPKLLGVYSTPAKAEERHRRARLLPGFAEEPECFVIDEYTIDGEEWTEGFVRVHPVGQDKSWRRNSPLRLHSAATRGRRRSVRRTHKPIGNGSGGGSAGFTDSRSRTAL
jgi:hypothetical protein